MSEVKLLSPMVAGLGACACAIGAMVKPQARTPLMLLGTAWFAAAVLQMNKSEESPK